MVFRLSKNKKPLDMCSEAKARYLLSHGYAVVHKTYPFTIRLKQDVEFKEPKSYILKIDPGSKQTGLALVDNLGGVCFLAIVEHRAGTIKSNLETRSGARRNRRNRETRYRRCKWINHRLKKGSKYKSESPRPEGWLPPSVESITKNIDTWVKRLNKLCNIDHIAIEYVKFDSQLMDNPEISGVEYQQGELLGYEVREYLLEKYRHTCQYCNGESGDTKLEVEHKQSKANGGSNKPKNLTIACRACNQEKGSLNLDQWIDKLKDKKQTKQTKLTEARIKCIEKVLQNKIVGGSDRYSAWVNSYRNRMIQNAKKVQSSIEFASGAKTKHNRIQHNIPKEHYYDALCVSTMPEVFKFKTDTVLNITAMGRGSRFRGRTNKCGIINKYLPRQKAFFGFQTGDMVKAHVLKGKKQGIYVGRVAVRSSGNFNIKTATELIQGIAYRYCTIIQHSDGYNYSVSKRTPI